MECGIETEASHVPPWEKEKETGLDAWAWTSYEGAMGSGVLLLPTPSSGDQTDSERTKKVAMEVVTHPPPIVACVLG